MTRSKVFTIVFVLLFDSLAFGQKKGDDLFSINDTPVKVNEFVYLYNKNHQGKAEEFTKEKIEEYLELFINFKLKVAEAESRGMDLNHEFIEELNTYKEELRKPFVAETDVLDKLVKEAYDRLSWEVKASHILINLQQDATPADTLAAYNKAKSIRERAIGGEPFENLARELSEDPSAKSNAGLLGYFSALQMVYPFEEAVFHLKVGEISDPVRSKFGYHVIKLEDKRPSSGEVEVSHILVRGAGEDARLMIDEVYNKLKENGDWNELCSQYSQDPGTKDNGGRLRPFGPGALASAPKFEEVAFSMSEPGELSVPFQTSFGWHIIRFEKKIPLPSFSELEESLKRKVARDDRMTISKSAAVEKRKKELNYNESAEAMNLITALGDSSLTKGNWSGNVSASSGELSLFSLNEEQYSLEKFAGYIVRKQSPTNVSPDVYVKQLYNQFVEESLSAMEDLKLQESNPEYRNLVNEYREGILLFSIMEKEIWNKASEDTLGQRAYYDKHVNSYAAGLRLEARIFSATTKEVINSAKAKVLAGDTLKPEDLKQFKSVTNMRAFEKGEHEAIDKISWAVGMHETEASGMYYLVEVNNLIPPGNKKFDEVRAGVISDYQDKLEEDWIGQLKNKYKIKVNAKGKKKAILELTSKDKF
ncbi:MAG: peptidylprolyl isomerase [Cyclobacteriaceae bacterium]